MNELLFETESTSISILEIAAMLMESDGGFWDYSVILKGGYVIKLEPDDWHKLRTLWRQAFQPTITYT